MEVTNHKESTSSGKFKKKIRDTFSEVPLLGWLFGIFVAVVMEHFIGDGLSEILGLPKIPVLLTFNDDGMTRA